MKQTQFPRYLWFASILAVFIIFSQFCHAQFTITDFDYQKDMPTVETLIKANWNKLFWMPNYDPIVINIMFRTRHPGDIAQTDKDLHIKILREGNQVAGFVTYYYAQPHVGHIELLAIDQKFRGHGYGKKVVDWVAHETAQHGAHILQLYVYTTNPAAIEFYQHLGFVVKTSYPGYLLLQKPI